MAGNRVSEATKGSVPSTDCMKVGTMMFMAKMVSSESMFTMTPTVKGGMDSGRRSMSGSASVPWRRTNSTRATMPTTAATQATGTLPLNTVDTP